MLFTYQEFRKNIQDDEIEIEELNKEIKHFKDNTILLNETVVSLKSKNQNLTNQLEFSEESLAKMKISHQIIWKIIVEM